MIEYASDFGNSFRTDSASEALRFMAKTSYPDAERRVSSLEKWNASEANEARSTAGTKNAATTGNAGLPGETESLAASVNAKSEVRIREADRATARMEKYAKSRTAEIAKTTLADFQSASTAESPETSERKANDPKSALEKAYVPSRTVGNLIFGSPRPESGGVEKTETIPGTAAGRMTNGNVDRRRNASLHPICGTQKDSGTGRYARATDERTAAATAAEKAAKRKNHTNDAATLCREAPRSLRTEKYFRLEIQTDFEKKNAAVPAKKKTMAIASETYAVTSSTTLAAPHAPPRKLRIRRSESLGSAFHASSSASAVFSSGVLARTEKFARESERISGTARAVPYAMTMVPLSSPKEKPESGLRTTVPSILRAFQKNGTVQPDANLVMTDDSAKKPLGESESAPTCGTVSESLKTGNDRTYAKSP